tara:strand:+ start:9743 stop:10498 length:756 start_codon:yes stop_codon:yes gene_type:complete
MSYLGIVKPLSRYASIFKDPSVLEVGVDKGQSMLPFIHNMSLKKDYFEYIGIDIKEDLCLINQLVNMSGISPFVPPVYDDPMSCNIFYFLKNSLLFLPGMIEKGCRFDIILLDGDHNYFTVSKELEYAKSLIKPAGIIVCDDYCGRWAERDLFYSSRDSHADIDIATPVQEQEGTGVRGAVNEFLIENAGWKMIPTVEGVDFAILYQEEHVDLKLIKGISDKYTHQIDIGYNFKSDSAKSHLKLLENTTNL